MVIESTIKMSHSRNISQTVINIKHNYVCLYQQAQGLVACWLHNSNSELHCNVPEEENSEYLSGVRQSARISFNDELFIGQQRPPKRSTLLAQTLEKNQQHIDERVVEGQGNIQDPCKDPQDIADKMEVHESGKDTCKVEG